MHRGASIEPRNPTTVEVTGAKGPKQKIAILDLEVLGDDTLDAEAVRVAEDLTATLRLRPKSGQGPFAFTPGSERKLVEEKIRTGCMTEARDCMVKLGVDLGTDVILFGHIERKHLGGAAGYQAA